MPNQQTIQESSTVNQIEEKFGKINQLIEQANLKLVNIYQQKEKEVVHRYQQDICKAKKQLQQLKKVNNDQQLARRVAHRKQQLECQRKKYLQSATQYAQKCKVYKQKLAKAISDTQDMQKQVIFLQNMINKADKKNYLLKKQQADIKQKQEQPHKSVINQTTMLAAQSSQHNQSNLTPPAVYRPFKLQRLKQDINDVQTKIQIQRKVEDKLNIILKDKRLQQSQFQRTFLDVVDKVKKKKVLKQRGKLPSIRKITDQDLNDFDKRQILQQFLSNQKIKLYFYKLIFNEALGKDQFKF